MRAIVVIKNTAYEYRQHEAGLTELLERKDPSVARILPAHEQHHRTVARALDLLGQYMTEVGVVRGAGTSFSTDGYDLVVTLGGDGTVLAASHSIGDDVPLLGINSAPDHSVGHLCAVQGAEGIASALDRVLAGLPATRVDRMAVHRNGKLLSDCVLNDALFCDICPAATSRYIVNWRGLSEEQKSSGFWISTGVGSTAAISSAGGHPMSWDIGALQYVARELFYPGVPGRYRVDQAIIRAGEPFEIISKMAAGRLYVDGSHKEFGVVVGDRLTFGVSPVALHLYPPGASV